MDYKNPVSGSGDGVFFFDILMKPANCGDCRARYLYFRADLIEIKLPMSTILQPVIFF